MRKMNIIFVVILFFMTIFLSSLPNYAGRYSTSLAEYEALYPDLDLVIASLSTDYDLHLEDSIMKFDEEAKIKIANYNVILTNSENSSANSTILITPKELYISNNNGDYIRGSYTTLNSLDFKDYPDLKTTSYLFLISSDKVLTASSKSLNFLSFIVLFILHGFLEDGIGIS